MYRICRIKFSLVLLFLLLFCNCNQATNQQFEEEKFAQENVYYSVHRFVDGDTFWITDGKGHVEKIRLIGIDAPEARNYGKKKEQPFGKEASAFVSKFLRKKKVRLEFDVQKKDQYDRTLAYIWLENGVMLNDYIVRQGFAVVSTYPPNVKYQTRFVKSERFAREKKVGMWR
ncbi:MAG: thermonuclease family protein [Paludibacteraceae bacterium]